MEPMRIMQMAGHADFKTTQKYIDLAGVVFSGEVAKLSAWYGAAAIPVEEIVNYDFVHEADLDGACSSGGREVRRERAHGRGLLQRLPDVRHDQRDRNRDRRGRGGWLCRRRPHSAPVREALVVAVTHI